MKQHHICGDPKCPCDRCKGANPAYVTSYEYADGQTILAALDACDANTEERECALDPARAVEACGMFNDREARCDWPREKFANAYELIAQRTPCRAFLAQFPAVVTDVHTGGGCMAWTLTLPSGEQLMFTEPCGGYPPSEADETVGVGYIDARCEWDEVDRPDYTWAELTAFVSGFLAGKVI